MPIVTNNFQFTIEDNPHCWDGSDPTYIERKLLKPMPLYAMDQLRLRFLHLCTYNHDPVKSARVICQMAFETEIGVAIKKVVFPLPVVFSSLVCERRRFLEIDADMTKLNFLLEPALDALETDGRLPASYLRLFRVHLAGDYARYRMCAIAALLLLADFYLLPEVFLAESEGHLDSVSTADAFSVVKQTPVVNDLWCSDGYGQLPEGMDGFGVIRLPDGRGLLVGGFSNTGNSNRTYISTDATWTAWTEIGNVQDGTFVVSNGVQWPTLIVLPDGDVLMQGFTNNAVLWRLNVGAGTWAPTAPRPDSVDAYQPGFVLLNSNEVLVCGGYNGGGPEDASVWRYNFNTDTWTAATSMNKKRADFVDAVKLLDGRIFVASGWNQDISDYEPTGEAYDPSADTWTLSANGMAVPREGQHMVVLNGGDVFIVNGVDSTGAAALQCERWSPGTNLFATSAVLPSGGWRSVAVKLSDGTVFVDGGWDFNSNTISNAANIFNEGTDSFTAFAPDPAGARSEHGAALFATGPDKIWVAGGTAVPATPYVNYVDVFIPTGAGICPFPHNYTVTKSDTSSTTDGDLVEPTAWFETPYIPGFGGTYALWGFSATDIFALGNFHTAGHWDGTSWSALPAPPFNAAYDMWGASSAEIWACGNTTDGLYKSTDGGNTWTLVTTPVNPSAIWGFTASDFWFVGQDGNMYHTTNGGASFTQFLAGAVFGGNIPIRPFGFSTSEVYTFAGPNAYKWNGAAWVLQGTLPDAVNEIGVQIWGSSGIDLYVVVNNGSVFPTNYAYRSTGGFNSFVLQTIDAPTHVIAIWGTGIDFVFAMVGFNSGFDSNRSIRRRVADASWPNENMVPGPSHPWAILPAGANPLWAPQNDGPLAFAAGPGSGIWHRKQP